MITILRGSHASLAAHCAALVERSPDRLSLAPSASPRGWNGLRNLIAATRRRNGEAADAVLARHRVVASLILGQPAETLDAAERDERRALAAPPESHLTHNLLVQRPLVTAAAVLLHELLAGRGQTLVVPDLAPLDRESLGALRTLYRRYPDSAPDLLAGFDPRRTTPEADDRGLLWGNPSEDVWRVVLGLQALPGSRVEDVAIAGSENGGPGAAEPSLGDADPALDSRAFAALESGAPLSPETIELAVAAVETAFASFAFATVLRLGLALLDRDPPLSPDQAATVFGLTGLAAHNRQFRSAGNRDLAQLLERCFTAALAAETRPPRRSALLYRLAVTSGRREGRLAVAQDHAERSIAEARRPEVDGAESARLEGWARNIRAYVLMRQGDLDRANADCAEAFLRLDRAVAAETAPPLRSRDPLRRELAFTHSLLADNLAALAQQVGDAERFAHWKTIADELAYDFPELARFEAILWIDLHRENLRLGLALAAARRGLESARAEQDALREYRYAVQAADLLYRLGEAREAYEAFDAVTDLRRRVGDPEFLLPAAAALAGTPEPDLNARAELQAALGHDAALAGRGDEAEGRMNEAIALAVESGERDTLLRVAVEAGRACLLLGQIEEAREAFAQAREIAAEEGRSPAPAAARLSLLLGLLDCGGADPSIARDGLELIPAALEDPDAWWELPRLLAALISAISSGGLAAPLPAAPLAALRTAAGERADCASLLAELDRVLGAISP